MADGLTCTGVSGLDDLLRRLDQLPLALSRQVARDALTAAGEIIQTAAEASAAEHRRSGELAEDIIMEVQVTSDFRHNRVLVGPGYPGPGLKVRKRGRYAGQQDSTTSPGVYARFLESGHGMPGYSWASRFGSARKRRRTGRQIELGSHDVPPYPWLKPAFDASSEQAVGVLVDRTREALERIDKLVS
jgi:HK97 gp10 family phage protein